MAYQGRTNEIPVGNEGEDVANNFYWEIQQRKLATHLHPCARGRREVEGGDESGKAMVGSVMTAAVNQALKSEGGITGSRSGRNGRDEIPHCSEAAILLHNH